MGDKMRSFAGKHLLSWTDKGLTQPMSAIPGEHNNLLWVKESGLKVRGGWRTKFYLKHYLWGIAFIDYTAVGEKYNTIFLFQSLI
jgi:hypothetical protein